MFKRKKQINQPAILENDVVLRVANLSKKFCRTLKRSIFYGTVDIARSMLGLQCKTWELRKNEFWALDDISFDLHKGETLGIIGVNGSGKSTLLRLITGIFPPDQGRIYHKGRIGALIAVGAGFHPHMTGRENIYLNGTILGMTRKEIEARLDEIIEFADIGDFLEAPVNTYSSGMRVRLGFSIAVHCEPDILLVDEVLSVGDLAFRNKSLRKMNEFRKKANAIIFISHNLEQVRILCDRIIILDKGKIHFYGDTHEGIVIYEEMSRDLRLKNMRISDNRNFTIKNCEADGEEIVQVIDVIVNGIKAKDNSDVDIDSSLHLAFIIQVNKIVEELYFSVGVLNDEYRSCIWLMSNDHNIKYSKFGIGKYMLDIKIEKHNLQPGVYFPNIAIRNGQTTETYERMLPGNAFKVKSDGCKLERGIVNVKEEWKISSIGD